MRRISAVVVIVDERIVLLVGILLFTLIATLILLPRWAAVVVAAVVVVMILDVTICSGACIGLYRVLVDWTSIPDSTPTATRLVFPTNTIRGVTTDCLT